MPVISFWNALPKENGQSYSIVALASYLAIEHNYRILIVNGAFADKTIESAFWKKRENKTLKKLQDGRIDISSGAEGLISAVASNKATPELIPNYTRAVFKNRLDVLPGLKTKIEEDFEKSMMLYKDLVTIANKYYDLVLVDLKKGVENPSVGAILKTSNIIIYTVPPNLINIDKFIKLRFSGESIVSSKKVMPLLARVDERSVYNTKNVSRRMRERHKIASVPYDAKYMEAVNDNRAAQFMTSAKLNGKTKKEGFFADLDYDCQLIINKIKELNAI